jgi:hypothetical protein
VCQSQLRHPEPTARFNTGMTETSLPDIGQAVTIIDEDNREYRTQLLASAPPTSMSLRRPTDLKLGAPLLIGDRMTLTWPVGDNVIATVTARLSKMRREDDLHAWDVDLLGPVVTAQRRAYPRRALAGPITVGQRVDPSSPVADRTVVGELLDISEVAVRFSVPGAEIWAARRTASVRLSFVVDSSSFELEGHVLNGRVTADGRREVVVRFDEAPGELQKLVAGR